MHHALRDDLTHILALRQLVHAGGEHVIERGKPAPQGLGHTRADVENPQTVEHPPHVALLAGFDAIQEIAC